MKRVSEKVRDIVEICPFTHLHDFGADAELTLAGYHFTDITADLMSKWIDRATRVTAGHGDALALAGFRGVGKSHFLATLGIIISRPELRSKISDQHVASRAEVLPRKHGPIASVRRGSGSSLMDELKNALAPILSVDHSELPDSLYDLLLQASKHGAEIPLTLLIDTAMDRDSRVARDDGVVLSEIAEAAKALGIFVAVALDDDISGADGPNASISGSFTIDYLDQEHLYKIVDSVIFSKHNPMRPVLKEIYEDYRASLPGFRWSEQRFTLLYPLHPATVEIAPLIRLYIHDFAMLGFAAEAGVKILGRPANSLIGIEEVFDGIEAKLRQVDALSDAFLAFDSLEREVISKTAVQFRHPARLVLKGLLMLSLSGEVVSAIELAASMMIADGDQPSLDIEALLDSFVEELPKTIMKVNSDGKPSKYGFRMTAKPDSDRILAEAVNGVSDQTVWKILLQQTAERYADFDPAGSIASRATPCSVEWRGAVRRGELVWPPSEDEPESTPERKEQPDWIIRVEPDNDDAAPSTEPASILWHIAKLTSDEKDVIRRYHLLHNDPGIREEFGEGLATAMHVHSISLEKIWHRTFLQDSFLRVGAEHYEFSDEARSAHGLSAVFSVMLAPIFESEYPEHPQFGGQLGLKEASTLISSFFSGTDSANAEAQQLAAAFAVPLGLAANQGDILVPISADDLVDLNVVKAAFADAESLSVVPLDAIAGRLQASPFGLTREVQHLILGALVAQRKYEFVTSSGNRINHRSLDLQIIWDDIVGVARPADESFAPERLLSWAKLITGNSGLKSIESDEDQALIVDSISGWLTGWKQSRIMDEFDALPDENLNAGIWRKAANLRKSFGGMADVVTVLVKNDVSLAEGLQMIADIFSDSDKEFENKKRDLRILRDFMSGIARRSEIINYLSLCEPTDNDELESGRLALLDSISSGQFKPMTPANDEVDGLWEDFKKTYSDYYVQRHDAVMQSAGSGEQLRTILKSSDWLLLESFSTITWLDPRFFQRAKELVREIRQLYCDSDIAAGLLKKPFCGCSFSLAEAERLVSLPNQLQKTLRSGLESFRFKFIENADRLIASASSDAMSTSIKSILATATESEKFSGLTSQEIRILKLTAENMSPESSKDNSIIGSEEENLSELPAIVPRWDNEVEGIDTFVNSEI